eukprot:4032689-Prymnesium_polylepis.1
MFERELERGKPGSSETDGISLLQFSLLMLNPQNDAVTPAREASFTDDLVDPLCHYWIACSHNSCTAVALELMLPGLCALHCVTSPVTAADIVGDQLTGLSSANMYR